MPESCAGRDCRGAAYEVEVCMSHMIEIEKLTNKYGKHRGIAAVGFAVKAVGIPHGFRQGSGNAMWRLQVDTEKRMWGLWLWQQVS